MRASIPEPLDGIVELTATLADGDAHPLALTELLSTWLRAVEVGFFGPGKARLTEAPLPQGLKVTASLECAKLPRAALYALHRLLKHFCATNGGVESFVLADERSELNFDDDDKDAAAVALPGSLPFVVSYAQDLHAAVRVEIEFASPLSRSHRDAISAALAIWDLLVVAVGREEEWGRRVDQETRLMAPAIIEHELVGYFAGFECVDFLVLMGVRLHRRLPIQRLTVES